MPTCNRLDFQTLGSQPVMHKNLPITASTDYFSNPTGSSVDNCRFSPIIDDSHTTLAFTLVDSANWSIISVLGVLDIIGQDPTVSKSNWLYVDICCFFVMSSMIVDLQLAYQHHLAKFFGPLFVTQLQLARFTKLRVLVHVQLDIFSGTLIFTQL